MRVKKKSNLLLVCLLLLLVFAFSFIASMPSGNKTSNKSLRTELHQLQDDYDELLLVNNALIAQLETNGAINGWYLTNVDSYFRIRYEGPNIGRADIYSDGAAYWGLYYYELSESDSVSISFGVHCFVSDGTSTADLVPAWYHSLPDTSTPEFIFVDENGNAFDVSTLQGDGHNIPLNFELVNVVTDSTTGYVVDCDVKFIIDTSVLAEEVE